MLYFQYPILIFYWSIFTYNNFVTNILWNETSHSHHTELMKVSDAVFILLTTTQTVPGFDRHMNQLTPENNARNPWFREYWQKYFGCYVDRKPPQDLACPSHRRIAGYQQDTKVRRVRVKWPIRPSYNIILEKIIAYEIRLVDKCVLISDTCDVDSKEC